MKNLVKSFKLTFILCGFLGIGYVVVLWVFALCVTPQKGEARQVTANGKVVGAVQIGQAFHQDIYFWGRPSAAGNGYDASRSGGSNKGPADSVYLNTVEHRIDDFIHHHPYLKRKDIPAEMVTASGSGLDPDISPRSAYIQMRRIAKARHCDVWLLKKLIDHHIEKPLCGVFGPSKVNVLKLNVDLDNMTRNH